VKYFSAGQGHFMVNKKQDLPTEKTPDSEPEKEAAIPQQSGQKANVAKVRSKNFVTLVDYLRKQDIDPAVFLHTNHATLQRISAGKQNADFFAVWRLQKAFKKISYFKVRNGKEPLRE